MTASDDSAAAGRRTVFLSYARADQAQAESLARALEQAGCDVWWDALIEGGAVFAKSIEAALERCHVVVVLWSQASIASDWVRDEAGHGRDLHKLVPVSLDGSLPPLGFRQYQSLDFSHWRGSSTAPEFIALVRAIAATRGEAPPAPTSVAHAPGARAPSPARRGVLVGAAALAAAGLGGVVAWRAGWLRGARNASPGNSIAVLPFKNLSGDAGQAYFSDGLSEELRATLARDLNLQVMAQTSAAKFRERQQDAVTIAAELGVAYLLDGSVRRAGDVVRVSAELVDGASGFSRWSQTFERALQDIFAVQSEIAGTVANALARQVGGSKTVGASGGTSNVAAYDAYLRGRALYDLSVDEASERAALAQFDAALALDPRYALAHAARARSLTAMANQYGKVEELGALYGAAIAAARRAIELAPDLAEAHSTLGFTLFQGRLDARAAREPFERSRELGAGEATVLARYAQYAARTGLAAAARSAIERALVLDKLNPLIHRAAGTIAYAARDYTGSIPPLRQALAMNPRLSRAHAAIGDALMLSGQLAAAHAEYQAEPAADFRLAGLAVLERRRGQVAAADAALRQLVRDHGDRVLYQRAQVHAQWGEVDAAIDCLQRALRVGDSGLIYLRHDPLLDPLRQDARFTQLLAAVGFD